MASALSTLFPNLRAPRKVVNSGISPDQQLVELVKDRLSNDPNLPVGKYGRDNDKLVAWFLQDRKYDADEAAKKLANFLRWRSDFGVDSFTEESLKSVASSGKAYVHSSLDVSGRPVLVINASKHLSSDDQEGSKKLCVYLVEKALEELQDGTEKILAIFDLRGFSTANADFEFIKFLVDIFHYYYPKRLAQILFVDAPFIFQPAWALVRPWVGTYAHLVRFCSTDAVRTEYFTPETIPPDFRA